MQALTTEQEITKLKDRITELESISIQLKMDAKTIPYLLNVTGAQFYSTTAPVGTSPVGSIWLKDTGVLATNTLHVYSGTSWVQIK